MKIILVLLLLMFYSCEDYGNPIYEEILGCTDQYSPAYNESANIDDESCTYQYTYASDINTLLNGHGCIGCHGTNGGLSLSSRASIVAGGNHGSAVILGDTGDNSLLIKVLLGTASELPGKEMDDGVNYGTPLSDPELDILRKWIEEGAP